ncbi:hypothetical protein [Burkholderia glumae]|uniref:hypothetical protein n=1 Tax=Burkholderia glumae TaxID=337 RepID=UPI003B9D50A2
MALHDAILVKQNDQFLFLTTRAAAEQIDNRHIVHRIAVHLRELVSPDFQAPVRKLRFAGEPNIERTSYCCVLPSTILVDTVCSVSARKVSFPVPAQPVSAKATASAAATAASLFGFMKSP